jgi:hypothetical protein
MERFACLGDCWRKGRRLVELDDARMTPQADEAASLELAWLLGALAQRPEL